MSSSTNPPPVNRPIRRRNLSPPRAPAPAASIAKLSSSGIPSLTAVRRTLFHSSTTSRQAGRAGSQIAGNPGVDGATNGNAVSHSAHGASTVNGVAPYQMRHDEDDFVFRDKEGNVILEGALNMSLFPRDMRTEEESQLERSLISDMYREYQSRYDVDAAELKYLLHNSLQEKVLSLQEDAWVFGAEDEVTIDQLQ